MATMQINQLMNDGRGLWYDHGDNVINILPPNVKPKSIENVERYECHETRSSYLAVKFGNGHVAVLRVCIDEQGKGIATEDLKEFQARCIMIHDI